VPQVIAALSNVLRGDLTGIVVAQETDKRLDLLAEITNRAR
jgi:hypothetical protein